jgi:hypothetical protein
LNSHISFMGLLLHPPNTVTSFVPVLQHVCSVLGAGLLCLDPCIRGLDHSHRSALSVKKYTESSVSSMLTDFLPCLMLGASVRCIMEDWTSCSATSTPSGASN